MTDPFVFSNGQVAYNAQDLIELCHKFSDDSANYLLRGDFEKWLAYIGEPQFAQFASETREAAMDDSKKLSAFTAKCQTVAKQPNIESSQASKSDTTEKSSESPKVSLLAIFSQFLHNLLSNRGRKNQNEVPIQQE